MDRNNLIIVFGFLYILVVSQGRGDDVSNKIIGGSEASPGEFPYQVSLRKKNRHFCGGSILNERWILTAGHCVKGQNAAGITAVVGTNLLSEGGDPYPVEKLLLHENYEQFAIRNDIGLVRLSVEILFGAKVHAVLMPDQHFNDPVDYPAELSGWGRIAFPGALPDALQRINLTIISMESCRAAFWEGLEIHETNICTLTIEGQGACHGDSGGPLTADGIQIGIVSFGMPCARGYPDVYTRVSSYVNWIKEKINNE